MTEDLDDLLCQHSAAGRPERFPAKACIFAGECTAEEKAAALKWLEDMRGDSECRASEGEQQ